MLRIEQAKRAGFYIHMECSPRELLAIYLNRRFLCESDIQALRLEQLDLLDMGVAATLRQGKSPGSRKAADGWMRDADV